MLRSDSRNSKKASGKDEGLGCFNYNGAAHKAVKCLSQSVIGISVIAVAGRFGLEFMKCRSLQRNQPSSRGGASAEG